MAECPFPLFGSSSRSFTVKVLFYDLFDHSLRLAKDTHTANNMFSQVVATSDKSAQPEMESAREGERGGKLERGMKKSKPIDGWLRVYSP